MRLIDRIGANPKVGSAWHETENGYWAELKPGWVCIYSGAHSCREDTLTELNQAIRDAEKCECSDCRSVLGTMQCQGE